MEIETPTPLCLVVENMPYDQFMVRSLHDLSRIEALLDKASELIWRWLNRFPPDSGRLPVLRSGVRRTTHDVAQIIQAASRRT
jgi:hypothetical protein